MPWGAPAVALPRSCPMRSPLMLLVLVAPAAVECLDNGLGMTPPRGWRSWNAYDCMSAHRIITDEAMRGAMRAVLDESRSVRGKPTSLRDLGFGWVSMDDGWQQCNCSVRQDEDPMLPKCSVDECFRGNCTWHDASGAPRVNRHRFPDMKALVDYGRDLGVKVGGYLNNCICTEAGRVPTHYEEDVAWFMAMGFDEVKVDNCGSSKNVSKWAELFNESGKAIRIENCHNSVPNPQRPEECPMHMYRTGGDIGPAFGPILGEAYSTLAFNDRAEPLSRPGCWAYPDMLEIGNFGGPEPLRSHEERSHFGLWCVISAPLILGCNMTDAATMDRVWATITNLDALAVNHDWAGLPGTLVKSYPAVGVNASQIGQRPCDSGNASVLGWQLSNGSLIAPGNAPGDMQCVDPSMSLPHEPGVYGLPCPPPTTGAGHVDCGLPVRNCSLARGTWEHDPTSKVLRWLSGHTQDKPRCLSATPQEISQFTELTGTPFAEQVAASKSSRPPWDLRVGDGRRAPAASQLGDCPPLGKAPPPTSAFDFDSAGRLRVGGAHAMGVGETCLSRAPLNGVQLWSKPLTGGRVAAFILNVLDVPQALAVPLADVPGLHLPQAGACAGRNVWAERDATFPGDSMDVSLAAHESAFFVLSCPHAATGADILFA